MAPNGESNSESPKLPSEKPSLAFIPGIDATQMPNKRLDVVNRKPTENADLFFTKEMKFLIMIDEKRRCEPTEKLSSVMYFKRKKNCD
jgi:hypothetical protein